MSVWSLIALRLVLAASAAALGAAIAVSFKRIHHLGLCLLISFAAGGLLAVALFDILPESIELIGLVRAVVSFASGYLLFFIISRYVSHICPACSATHTELDFKAVTLAMIAALSVHSFMDGLAIYSGTVSETKTGFLILLAVVYHKIPEGMALSLIAMESKISRRRAFLLSVSVESVTTLAGGMVGYWLITPVSSGLQGYVLGHVAGAFVFLVIHALLSEVFKHHPWYTLSAALGGALSIFLVSGFVH